MVPAKCPILIESPIGLHILRCDAIQRGETVSFYPGAEKILSHMNDKRREARKKPGLSVNGAHEQRPDHRLKRF